jgi:hypothetical protein
MISAAAGFGAETRALATKSISDVVTEKIRTAEDSCSSVPLAASGSTAGKSDIWQYKAREVLVRIDGLGPVLYAMARRSCGRVAEGGGLLNRYTLVKAYRGFESLRLRQFPIFSCPEF